MIKGCQVGGKRTLVVTVEKIKKGVPTVIEIMGERYVLDSKNISKAKEKRKKNERCDDVQNQIDGEFQSKKYVSIKQGKKTKRQRGNSANGNSQLLFSTKAERDY